jgi:hypothetical protein
MAGLYRLFVYRAVGEKVFLPQKTQNAQAKKTK